MCLFLKIYEGGFSEQSSRQLMLTLKYFKSTLKNSAMPKNPPIKKIFVLLVALTLILFVSLGVANPSALISLSKEDGLLENLTAGVLFSTFFLSCYFYFKFQRTANIFLLFAAFGLVGFLDEISFGRRMFPVPMPKSHGLTIDGVHDLFHLIRNVIRTNLTYHPTGTLIVISTLLIISFCVWLNTKTIRQRVLVVLAKYEIIDLVLVIVFFVAVSQCIDTFKWRIFAYRTVEECLEFNAAVALMACSLKCRQVLRLNRINSSDQI